MPSWRRLQPDQVEAAIAGGTVVLDFFHDGCAPCHALEPRLAQFWRRHPGRLTI